MNVTISTPSLKSVALLGAGALLALGVVFGPKIAGHIHPPKPAPAPAPAPTPAPAPKPDWFGVVYPKGSKELIASMPRLRAAAPGLMDARDVKDTRPVLLYKAWTDLFDDYPHYPAQQIGDCVSFGHGHGMDLLQCVEWCLANPGKRPAPSDIQETDTEWIYGASREISGNLGLMDGSYGGAAVKALTEWGVVSRRMLGTDGSYSGRRAKQWGRAGPPDSVKTMAAKFKLGSTAQVTSWDELVAALHNGNPVTICSGQGFNLQRDDQGFCRAQGHWGHCMVIAGVRFDREGACILQSWGMDTPSGPRALDQPPYSFWADRRAIEHILGEGDSWALSKAPKFGAATAKGKRRLPSHWRKAA